MRSASRIVATCTVVLVVLISCAQPEDEFSFAETVWMLSSLGGAPPLEDTNLTLEFGNENFNGYSGCNWYGGGYTVTDSEVNFADIASTARACAAPEGVMQQEEMYGRALGKVTAYHVTGNRLELVDGTGTVTLTFTRGGRTPEP